MGVVTWTLRSMELLSDCGAIAHGTIGSGGDGAGFKLMVLEDVFDKVSGN